MSNNVRYNLEKIIIASAIKKEEFFVELQSLDVASTDFKSPMCATVYGIMSNIFKKNVTPTESYIEQELLLYLYGKYNSDNKKVNELMYLYKELLTKYELDDEVLHIHFERFQEYKLKDGLTEILNNAKKMADDGHTKEVLNYILDSYITSFNERKEVDGINFYDLMRKDLESYNPYAEREIIGSQSKTGIFELDTKYLNGGVAEGTMCIIAGRPGSGKSTLAKVIAINNAKDGKKVLFVSLEMSEEQIKQGYYAQIARVDYGKIMRKELTAEEYNKIMIAVDKEENKLRDFHIVERDSITISQFINLLIRYKKKEGIDVVFLDYIQQVRLDNGSVPKNEQEYSLVSELVRTIIKKLKLQAYLCAQVNRDCEKRNDKKPMASDLRSTGKLEQDAGYIFTTYRDEYYNPLDSDHPTERPKTMDISVVKNRFGPMGVVEVMFEGEYQNICNMMPRGA